MEGLRCVLCNQEPPKLGDENILGAQLYHCQGCEILYVEIEGRLVPVGE